MTTRMDLACVVGRTGSWVRCAYRKLVLVDLSSIGVMQVPVVKVVDMSVVSDGFVATSCLVIVFVLTVHFARHGTSVKRTA